MAREFAKRLALAVFLAAPLVAPLAGPGVAAAETPTTFRQTQTVQVKAEVIDIDKAQRAVTIKLPDGAKPTLKLGPEVRNFDQIAKGDEVDVLSVTAGELELKRPTSDTPTLTFEDVSETAPPGWKPAGFAAIKTTAVVKITTIKPETGEITFIGPLGNVFQATVADEGFRKTMQDFRAGDLVQAGYVEALSIVVGPKPQK